MPSSGVGERVGGFIGLGLGVLNLATSPLCYTDIIDPELQDVCLGASLVVGGVGLAVGIPLLIVGYNKRADLLEWRERNGVAEHLLNTQLVVNGDGSLLIYRGSF